MVRLGVIGTGNIGLQHIQLIASGEIENVTLSATASRRDDPVADCLHFSEYQALLDSDLIDAVLIATPTMNHVELAKHAFDRGLHVLIEKPVAMSAGQATALIENVPAELQFAVMLNQRFHPVYSTLKHLMDDAVIGRINRFTWTMTAWYRPDIYYRVSEWRGTWPGEGGGLLINQCIHNIDVMQWLFGLPESLTAKIGFGRFHNIEVEDDVTAMMNYANGTTGLLIASSGEAPGVNRLEIAGDLGLIIFDGDTISVQKADQSISEHCETTTEMFGMPAFTAEQIQQGKPVNQHAAVLQNFVNAIENGEALLTPGKEGLRSLQLANAMLLSAWEGQRVSVPIDSQHFEEKLSKKIVGASLRKAEDIEVEIDMEKSYR